MQCKNPLLPGCSNKVKNIPCEDARVTRKLFDWSERDSSLVWTHKSCACNERVALCLRHQVDDGARFEPGVEPILLQEMLKLVKQCEPISKMAIAMGYSGAKRMLALRAIESFQVESLDLREDAKVRMFLKDDKYHTEEMKAPRCIQYRSKRYAITLAQYTYPIEHAIYKHRREGVRCFAKGRNLEERAADLKQAWELFQQPVAWLLDHSKFDAHITKEHIRCATKLNSNCFKDSGHKRFVRKLMLAQRENKGSTKNGTKFRTRYTRMSGDQNTGLDNSTINYSMISLVLQWARVRGTIYVDGDDSVVIVEKRDLSKLAVKQFERFGMVTKEEFAWEFEHVEFCQTRPVWNGCKWIMTRNPDRVLDRINWTVKKFPVCLDQKYIRSVLLGESAINEGVPVLGPLSNQLLAGMKPTKGKLMDVDTDVYVKQLGKEKGVLYYREPTDESRLSYFEAWGVSPLEQMRLEIMTMRPPLDPVPQFDDMCTRQPFLVM